MNTMIDTKLFLVMARRKIDGSEWSVVSPGYPDRHNAEHREAFLMSNDRFGNLETKVVEAKVEVGV